MSVIDVPVCVWWLSLDVRTFLSVVDVSVCPSAYLVCPTCRRQRVFQENLKWRSSHRGKQTLRVRIDHHISLVNSDWLLVYDGGDMCGVAADDWLTGYDNVVIV